MKLIIFYLVLFVGSAFDARSLPTQNQNTLLTGGELIHGRDDDDDKKCKKRHKHCSGCSKHERKRYRKVYHHDRCDHEDDGDDDCHRKRNKRCASKRNSGAIIIRFPTVVIPGRN